MFDDNKNINSYSENDKKRTFLVLFGLNIKSLRHQKSTFESRPPKSRILDCPIFSLKKPESVLK